MQSQEELEKEVEEAKEDEVALWKQLLLGNCNRKLCFLRTGSFVFFFGGTAENVPHHLLLSAYSSSHLSLPLHLLLLLLLLLLLSLRKPFMHLLPLLLFCNP